MQRGFLVAMLLVLLAGAAFLAYGPRPEGSDPVGDGTTVAPVDRGAGPGGFEPSGDALVAPPAAERTTESIFDDPEDEDLPSLADGEGVRVEVFRRVAESAEQRPVAGARVLLLDTGRIDETLLQERLVAGRDVTAVMRDLGAPYRTRGDGSVVVPYPLEAMIVAASAPGSYAFLLPATPEADGVVRVELRPDRPLMVRVRDVDGQPIAGVPVAIRTGSGGGGQDLLGAMTRVDGTAQLRNLALLEVPGFVDELFVGVSALLPEPVEVEIRLDALPGDPIELQLPPLGAVRVEVRERGGAMASGNVLVMLKPQGVGGGMALSSQVLTALLDEGAAIYPHVGLGLDLAVEARDLDVLRVWRSEFAGPGEAGEQIVVRLDPSADEPIVLARVVDPAGMPLRDARLQVQTQSDRTRATNHGVRTDDEGVLRVVVEEPIQPGERRMLKFLRPADETNGLPPLHGELLIDGPLGPGENDFGRLQLQASPLIAEGVVIDADGQPVPGVSIRPELQRVSQRGSISWRPQFRLAVRTDGRGRFAFRGVVEPGVWRLRAQADGWADSTQEFPLGASGLVVPMTRGALLVGRLLLDEDVPPEKLIVFLEIARADGSQAWDSAEPDGSGGFEWDQLPEGIGTLHLQGQQGEIVATIEGLTLTAGRPTTDSRVDPIDLRGRLTYMRFEFLDPDGDRVRRVKLTSPGPDGVDWEAWDGTLEAITAKAPLDLTTDVAGHRSQTLVGVAESRTVTLDFGPIVSVQVENPELVPDGHTLVVWFGDGERIPQSTVGEDGSCDSRVSGPGMFTLRLGLRRGRRTEALAETEAIEVRDLNQAQVYPIRLNPDSVAAAQATLEESDS